MVILSALPADAQEPPAFPKLDVEMGCTLFGADGTTDFKACLSRERAAREALREAWEKLDPLHRADCLRLEADFPTQSYEMLSQCIANGGRDPSSAR